MLNIYFSSRLNQSEVTESYTEENDNVPSIYNYLVKCGALNLEGLAKLTTSSDNTSTNFSVVSFEGIVIMPKGEYPTAGLSLPADVDLSKVNTLCGKDLNAIGITLEKARVYTPKCIMSRSFSFVSDSKKNKLIEAMEKSFYQQINNKL